MKPPLSPPQPFICSQRRQKACFLSPRTGSKITVTKEKERRKSRSEEKERKRTGKKAIVALLVFITATLVFGQKNCPTQKVHLAIDKAFKNLARHIRQTRKNEPEPRRIDFKGEEGDE